MPDSPFGLDHVREICLAPFLQRERQLDASRAAQARREDQRSSGVSWSGLRAGPTRPARTPEQVRAAADAALARAAAFAESPRGRFLLGLRGLEDLGWASQAESARTAFARGFADPDRPACPAEIGAALCALARIDRPEARAACRALAELLGDALGLAAA